MNAAREITAEHGTSHYGIDGDPFSSAPRTAQQLREQLADLCMQVELLRNWWELHGDQLRAIGGIAAGRVHDNFTDAASLSRSIARQACIELDQAFLKSFDWHPATGLPPAPEVGPAPALRYTGGTLGLEDYPEIMAEAPDGLYRFTLEHALRNIDKFAEPGRTRILQCLPLHYQMAEAEV